MSMGYSDYKELGSAEIVYITPESVEVVSEAKRYEDLFVPLGVLWIPDFFLRGSECGRDAL